MQYISTNKQKNQQQKNVDRESRKQISLAYYSKLVYSTWDHVYFCCGIKPSPVRHCVRIFHYASHFHTVMHCIWRESELLGNVRFAFCGIFISSFSQEWNLRCEFLLSFHPNLPVHFPFGITHIPGTSYPFPRLTSIYYFCWKHNRGNIRFRCKKKEIQVI